MFRSESRIKKELFRLREEKRELKKRIGQSMSGTGPNRVTGKCKSLQKDLANVVRTEKKKKQKLRRR